MVIVEKKVNGAEAAELARFARRAQSLAGVAGEVAALLTGSGKVKELNRRFRRKNKATDVLSFPGEEGGDIAISADIARENARRYGHSAADEVKILVLHGMLHLAGYDHEADNGRMADVEARLRARLKLPGSLIERAHGVAAGAAAPRKSRQGPRKSSQGKKTMRKPRSRR